MKVPDICPAPIIMLDGMLTDPVPDADRLTVTGLVAGPERVTVPVADFVNPSVLGRDSVSEGLLTVTVVLPGRKPPAEANSGVDPKFTAVTTAVVLDMPAGTVTLAGAVATVGSKAVSVRVTPLPVAGAPSETVTMAVPPRERLRGFGVSVMVFPALAVIMTVDGALSTKPSFTIS